MSKERSENRVDTSQIISILPVIVPFRAVLPFPSFLLVFFCVAAHLRSCIPLLPQFSVRGVSLVLLLPDTKDSFLYFLQNKIPFKIRNYAFLFCNKTSHITWKGHFIKHVNVILCLFPNAMLVLISCHHPRMTSEAFISKANYKFRSFLRSTDALDAALSAAPFLRMLRL